LQNDVRIASAKSLALLPAWMVSTTTGDARAAAARVRISNPTEVAALLPAECFDADDADDQEPFIDRLPASKKKPSATSSTSNGRASSTRKL
jgi:hypothetical protein